MLVSIVKVQMLRAWESTDLVLQGELSIHQHKKGIQRFDLSKIPDKEFHEGIRQAREAYDKKWGKDRYE